MSGSVPTPISPIAWVRLAAALVAGLVAAAGVVAVTTVALGSSAAGAAVEQGGPCPSGNGRIGVRIVVDNNDPSGADATCVDVAAGSSGYDVLVARARQLGRPAPRTDGNGLLCGIDGTPETGCVEDVDGQFRYWSYWTGRVDGTTWTYSRVGMDARRVQAGDVDGWRLVVAANGGPTPRPRRCPDGSTCTEGTATTLRPTPTVTAAPSGGSPPPPPPSESAGSTTPTTPGAAVAGATATASNPPSPPSRPGGSTPRSGSNPAPPPGDIVPPTVSGTVLERSENPLDASSSTTSTTTTVASSRSAADERATALIVENAAAQPGNDGATGWIAFGLVLGAGALATVQARRTRLRR